MKKILAGLMIMMSMSAIAQKTYEVSVDPKNGSQVFSGPITFNDLKAEPTFTWLQNGEDRYKPKKKPIAYLKDHLKEYNMVVFMGTWCPDSHELIPKFGKVLETVGYPMSQLSLYGVDRSKTVTPADKKYNITSVPTFILLKNGKEVGRITETVHKKIEIDLVNIIKKDAAPAP